MYIFVLFSHWEFLEDHRSIFLNKATNEVVLNVRTPGCCATQASEFLQDGGGYTKPSQAY